MLLAYLEGLLLSKAHSTAYDVEEKRFDVELLFIGAMEFLLLTL